MQQVGAEHANKLKLKINKATKENGERFKVESLC